MRVQAWTGNPQQESVICVIKNPVYHSKAKHIEIRHHFIRDSYEKRLIEMVKIHTDNNVVDLLTKAFDKSKGIDNPTIYASLIEQFWQNAALSTIKDGVMAITATIDRNVKVLITEASIRRHLNLGDSKVKTSKARRKARIVISENEDAKDPSKQGRSLIEELDMDVDISLVPPHAADQGRKSDDTQAMDKGKAIMQESEQTKKIKKRIQV
nr:putative ribonuclease H-like domain-containing protein [Tanacetum cinerariifolium]